MCEFDPCGPLQSGRDGPRVDVVVDRRAHPWVGGPRDRRTVDVPVIENRRIAERNRREGHVIPGSRLAGGFGQLEP